MNDSSDGNKLFLDLLVSAAIAGVWLHLILRSGQGLKVVLRGKCKKSCAKMRDARRGSVGDPWGILRGSIAKIGDPVGIVSRFYGGSAATNIPFYNIKKGKAGGRHGRLEPQMASGSGPSNATWLLEIYLTRLPKVDQHRHNKQLLA